MARTTDDSEDSLEQTVELIEIKDRLKLAEETIAILRSSNSQLDKHLVSVKSDFSVLETLLIESGQTLQRLQEMYHKEKEQNSLLTAQNLLLTTQNNLQSENLAEANFKILNLNNSCEKSFDSEINHENNDSKGMIQRHREDKEISIRKVVNSSSFNSHEYNISIRNSLRDLAENMCDELIRVEEDIDALEPILKLVQPETSDSNFKPISNKYDSRAKSNRNIRGVGPDFLFGSPSSRLPLKDSDDMHEDGEEDEEYEGDEGYEGDDIDPDNCEEEDNGENVVDEYERSFEYVEDIGRESDEEKGDRDSRLEEDVDDSRLVEVIDESPRKQLDLELEGDDDDDNGDNDDNGDDGDEEVDEDEEKQLKLWNSMRRKSNPV